MNDALDWKPSHFTDIRLHVEYVHRKTLFVGSLFKKNVARYIASEGAPHADWIIVFGETHWACASYVAKRSGARVMFALRSDSIEENRSYLRIEKPSFARALSLKLAILKDTARERGIAKQADLISFQSEADRDHYVARNPVARAKSVVIRGDIRQARFKKEYARTNRSTSCRSILFVGAMGKRKGLAPLLRAVVIAAQKGITGFHLDIVANKAGFEPFAAILEEAGLSGMATFQGKSDNPLEWMTKADLVIVPSIFDSYPNVVLEALHVGVPVIGSRAGGIPDMLRHDELLFEAGSSESIAEKIIALVSDDSAYRKARELCESRRDYFDFDWAAEWEKCLASIEIKER
jgi:glycosyltransferase involved in cell wall biosynthesis